ncbi:penicillin-binding protein activator [Azospirillum sp. TSO22-1]|uniref:penicillin-binding protein activator n=1 Tax=Azospirillum sp. TSO22-1 TaxID=716789 RepID=UPI000D64408C|nr:penicillin-binding protein activator [Azospirillum sp. TSO22-1]
MARLATPFSRALRSRLARGLGVTAVLALAACAPNVAAPPPVVQAPQPPSAVQPMAPQVQKVALLLPLTGPSAGIGQPMLDAAQLALFDVAGETFQLLPRDTKGTPQGAAEAARQALAEGARLIVGPLFGQEVQAVKPVAAGAGVDVVAFTTDATLAGNGTWVMGFVPLDQVQRVTGFARSRGVTRFVALAPRSPYGDAVVGALQTAAQRFGGQVAQVERYEPALADPAVPARQVAQAPVAPQAVMLAEGGEKLRALGAALAANGVDPGRVKLLGTGLWDEPGLGREPALVGAWYAAPAPEQRTDFETRFEALYGKKPPRLATLAYDATALAGTLARMGGVAPFDRANLTNPNGFAGVDGLFRLRPNGAVERGLAVLEITPDGARVLDPAPQTWEVLGQ